MRRTSKARANGRFAKKFYSSRGEPFSADRKLLHLRRIRYADSSKECEALFFTREDLKKQKLKILNHVGVDGPMFVYREIVEDMNSEDFDVFMDIHFKLCDKRSNLGYSEHGLVIAQKV